MSPDLIAFLKAWHDWATNGAPDGKPFWRYTGLCGNALCHGVYGHKGDALFNELNEYFCDDDGYPFGGEEEYTDRFHDKTQHLCPKRLAWVRERLIEAGEMADA